MTAPIVQRLRDAAAALHGDRVSMQTLAQAHGPDAHGTLLLLMAMPCLLPVPGVGTVLGLGLLAVAAAMWRGQGMPRLPRRVAELELSRPWAQRVLVAMASAYTVAGRHARERWCRLASSAGSTAMALAVALMAAIIVLPIPFGNVLPALALVLLGLGLVFRDGLAVALGLAVSGLTVAAMTGLAVMVGLWGSDWLVGLM